MGRLKRLELENFKSYRGKQIIGEFNDFTCIIGPNGAGKSNMMDAISFVLGIQSKHLRSSRLKDLIYRKDINSPPERKASVKLIYELSDDELKSTKLETTDIIFSRTILSTGVSTYRLNEKEVTFEAYEQVLQQIGVLVKARNFLVFQGDVESVASKTPLELTHLLEQISGSDQYQKEYEELKQKKEEIEESAIFSLQKKKMYETQKREVKLQKNEAEYFQHQKQELEELKTELTLWKILRVNSELESALILRSQYTKEVDEIEEDENEIDEVMAQKKANMVKINKAITANDKLFAQKDKELAALGPKLTSAKERKKKLEKKLAEQEVMRNNMNNEKIEQQKVLKELKKEINQLKQTEHEIDQQLTEESSSLHMEPADLEEYSLLREAASNRTAKERAECMLLEKEISGLQRRIDEIQSQESFSRDENTNFDQMLIETNNRKQKLEKSITQGNEDKNKLLIEKNQLLELSKSCEAKKNELQERYEQVCAKLQDAGDAKRASKQEEKMIEAIETMKRLFPGVHGKLADLCRPIQKKYAIAVSTAGGKQMDAIVVDTKKIATDCIQYLKEHRIGSCLFLPLNNITPKEIPDSLRNLASTEKFRICIDLITTDSDIYRPALLYAVGSAVVCENLDEARELCFTRGERLKVVTLGGHVISKTGTMTGGTVSKEGSNRWEEKEIEKLRKEKIELEEEINENKRNMPSRQQLIEIENRLKTVQTTLNLCDAEYKVCNEKSQQLEQQQILRNNSINELESDRNVIIQSINEKKVELKDLENIIQLRESEIFRDFSARIGINNIREYENNRIKKHRELIDRKNKISEQTSALEARLEYELKKDFDGTVRNSEKLIQKTKNDLELMNHDIEQFTTETNEINKLCDKLNQQKDESKKERKVIENELRTYQTNKNSLLTKKDIAKKNVSIQEISIETLRLQLQEILKKAQVDEIALPGISFNQTPEKFIDLIWKGSTTTIIEDQSLSNSNNTNNNNTNNRSKSRQRQQIESSNTTTTTTTTIITESDNQNDIDEKVVIVDLSSVKNTSGSNSKDTQLHKEETLSNQIQTLISELEDIQPNMHAMERYDGVVEKLKECSTVLEKVTTDVVDISARFEEIQELRKTLFQNCFGHVSESLATIYRDLTRSTKHPQGGNAYLTLDNTEEPYNGGIRYTAMPPSKRFRDMDQLSGGEKTVAALALLFSIHSYRQAPFFVLDEVDAALDNVNVQKVCNYIRKRSKNFQCIVISLKDMFFEHADMLVGVCKDIPSISSKILTLSLKEYPIIQPSERTSSQSSSISTPQKNKITDELTRELAINEQNETYDEEKESLSDYPPSSPSVRSTASSDIQESPRNRKRDRNTRQKLSKKQSSLSKKLTEEVIHEEVEEEDDDNDNDNDEMKGGIDERKEKF